MSACVGRLEACVDRQGSLLLTPLKMAGLNFECWSGRVILGFIVALGSFKKHSLCLSLLIVHCVCRKNVVRCPFSTQAAKDS